MDSDWARAERGCLGEAEEDGKGEGTVRRERRGCLGGGRGKGKEKGQQAGIDPSEVRGEEGGGGTFWQ